MHLLAEFSCLFLYWLWIVLVLQYILSIFSADCITLALYPSSLLQFLYLVIIVYLGKFVYKFIWVLVCLLLVAFHYLFSEVICRCGSGWHMSLGSRYHVFCLHHCDLVTSPIVVFWSMPNYCSMHPWSPVFMSYSDSWSCRLKGDIYMSICFFLCSHLLFHAAWSLSSLSHMMGGLLYIGIRPLAGLLTGVWLGLIVSGILVLTLSVIKTYIFQYFSLFSFLI